MSAADKPSIAFIVNVTRCPSPLQDGPEWLQIYFQMGVIQVNVSLPPDSGRQLAEKLQSEAKECRTISIPSPRINRA